MQRDTVECGRSGERKPGRIGGGWGTGGGGGSRVRGKSSKRVGNVRNGAGVTLFNISQPKKGKKNEIPSPRSLRYLISVSLNCKRDSHVLNGKRDSATRFTSSKFCEQSGLYKSVPFTEKQPRRPETAMKNGIRISVWNIPSAKKNSAAITQNVV